MSGYPTGAEHDSRAPYNQTENIEDLCRYCHGDGMDAEDYDRAGLCKECHEQEQAEMRRDER